MATTIFLIFVVLYWLWPWCLRSHIKNLKKDYFVFTNIHQSSLSRIIWAKVLGNLFCHFASLCFKFSATRGSDCVAGHCQRNLREGKQQEFGDKWWAWQSNSSSHAEELREFPQWSPQSSQVRCWSWKVKFTLCWHSFSVLTCVILMNCDLTFPWKLFSGFIYNIEPTPTYLAQTNKYPSSGSLLIQFRWNKGVTMVLIYAKICSVHRKKAFWFQGTKKKILKFKVSFCNSYLFCCVWAEWTVMQFW